MAEHPPTLEELVDNFNPDNSTADAPSSRSVIGQVLYDPDTREPLGVLFQDDRTGDLFLRGPAPVATPGMSPAETLAAIRASGSRFQPGPYMLANGQIVAVGNTGFYAASAVTPPSSGGTSGNSFANDIAFLHEQERLLRERNQIDAARSLADSITFLEQQHENALATGRQSQVDSLAIIAQQFRNTLQINDINATRSLADQLIIIEQNFQNARTLDEEGATRTLENQLTFLAEQQGFATGEREASEEFTAGENALSRENALRLEKLREVGSTRRQVLDLQARGRELKASLIGKDAFRSAAAAQGLTPTRGTPADLLGDELNTLIRQPVPQPESMNLEDIQMTIDELEGTAAAGLPSAEGFGLSPVAGLRHGGVIEMGLDDDGSFSPTVRRNSVSPTVRRMGHGGSIRRRSRRPGGGDEELQVLVGEEGPELMTVSEDEIRISPVATAEHGISIRRPSFGGRTIRPLGRGGDTFTPGRPGPTISPTVTTPPARPPGTAPTPGGPETTFPVPERPVPTISPVLGGPEPFAPPIAPRFEPSNNAITQALASIFAHLGFQESGIPTFREGEFGGMVIPPGGLSVFDRLGVSPSLIRTQAGPGAAQNFWISPTGELQFISDVRPGLSGTAGGQHFAPFLPSTPQDLGLRGSGFRMEDFLNVNPADLVRAGFNPANAVPFTGQDILRDVSPTPFPLRRSPIAFRPTDESGDFTEDQGFFLPAPRTVANIYRRSRPEVQAALLSAWETAFLTEPGIFGELDFFTPRGSANPANAARLA